MYCTNCGFELSAGQAFCPRCGKQIGLVARAKMGDQQALTQLY